MVSRESREYWQANHKNPQFGAVGNKFNLHGLRQGMAMRQPPANEDVKCIRSQIDRMPCEWVVAPGADPDVRLLYLHGGGYGVDDKMSFKSDNTIVE
jgi:acetyl esterase/lipase